MSDGRTPPHHLQAEENLLGALLLSKHAIEQATDIVDASDFYQPSHRVIYDVICTLHKAGEPVDPITVAAALQSEGPDILGWVGGQGQLVAYQSTCPSTAAAARYARIIVDHAVLRRLISLGERLIADAYEFKDAADIVDVLKADLSNIEMPSASLPDGLMTVDQFMDQDFSEVAPYVIPDLFRMYWRMMLVAEEGAGKTLLSQQLALCAAQGIHPFTREPMAPVNTLVVDAENPEERIYDGFKLIESGIKDVDKTATAWLWHRPGGIDLRNRADRAAFERVLQETRPQLVCICPLYKVYSAHKGDQGDETAARDVQGVLDDLRIRYRFALLIEHHAPKEQNGVRRLNPYGSVLWQRWIDLGRSLVRANPTELLNIATDFNLVGGYKGDRVRNEWPSGLRKATSGLPWEPRWNAVVPPPKWRHYQDDDDTDPF